MSRLALVVLAIAVAALAISRWPPIPQDPAYHVMADRRTLLGIPNALNVLSNLPFAVVGVLGMAIALRRAAPASPARDADASRWPYATLFAGVALTALGSAWYHLAPDNDRLVWDRLPMTVGFMGLLAAVIAENVGPSVARALFVPLLLAGAGSVFWWHATEVRGAGDLRPYALVQYGSLVAVVLLLALNRGRDRDSRFFTLALVAYAIAKACEAADARIYGWGHVVSGHTLKHLAAAGAVAFLAARLLARRRREALPAVPHAPGGPQA